MEVVPPEVVYYAAANGVEPFVRWLTSLRDERARQKIEIRLARVKAGNLGDYRTVGEGVFELRIDYGPGYRVYFGRIGEQVVVLLGGGDKTTQARDIDNAHFYWDDFRRSYEKA